MTYTESSVLAQPLAVGGYHYPPFMIDSTEKGLYVKLTEAIEQHSSVKFQWKYYPFARADHLFNLGYVHLEVGSSPLWNQTKPVPGLYTDTFYELEDVAVFHKNRPFRARNIQDIKNQKVGIVRGYSFPQFTQTFNKNIASKIEGANEDQLLHLLISKRIDQVFMSKHVFLYLKKHNQEYKELDYVDVVGRYPISMRVHPKRQSVIPELNQAIQQLKQKKIIEKIFELAR